MVYWVLQAPNIVSAHVANDVEGSPYMYLSHNDFAPVGSRCAPRGPLSRGRQTLFHRLAQTRWGLLPGSPPRTRDRFVVSVPAVPPQPAWSPREPFPPPPATWAQ